MSVVIDISIDEGAVTAKLDRLDGFMSEPGVSLLQAGYEVKNYIQLYHEDFDGKWRGSHYMSGPRSGQWEKDVAADWQPPFAVDANTVSIINTHPHLAHKITGGTITPVHAGALTIPLIPEAKGISAREYEASSGNKLFIAKGVIAHKGSGEEIVPVYALKQSVTQEPWPGAMPPQDELQSIFDKAFAIELEPILAS